MMNSSSLFNAVIAAAVAAALCGIGAGATLTRGASLDAAAMALATITACGSLFFVNRARHSVHAAYDVLREAATGRLDARIVGVREGGELRLLHQSVNRLLDLTEAFTKEADAAMAMTSDGRYFRHIREEGLVGEFAGHARLINRALTEMQRRTGACAVEVSGIGESIKSGAGTIASNASALAASTRHMTEVANRTAALSQTVSTAAQDASDHVASIAAATEQVAGGINEAATAIQVSAGLAQETVRVAAETDSAILDLNQAAQKIGEVVNLINDIAAQTNLLALNATIEAARAGEAGKGFAVVAGEVKTLANQTARATDEIARQIDGMRGATEAAVSAVRGIAGKIRDINDNTIGIAAATEQQSTAVAAINESIRRIAAGVQTVAETIGEVAATAGSTSDTAGQVLAAAGELANRSVVMNTDIDAFVSRVCSGIKQG